MSLVPGHSYCMEEEGEEGDYGTLQPCERGRALGRLPRATVSPGPSLPFMRSLSFRGRGLNARAPRT